MIALAMLAAHSVDPVAYNPYIEKITQGTTADALRDQLDALGAGRGSVVSCAFAARRGRIKVFR